MLKKEHRLAKSSAVLTALKTGRAFFNPEVSLKFFAKNEGMSRFTVVVSKKVDKRAVKRNRLKRLFREYLRLHLKSLALGDYVVMLKTKAAQSPEKNLINNFDASLKIWKILKNPIKNESNIKKTS